MNQGNATSNLLENRVILITGAGSGIGRSAALSFAQQGATIVLLGRTIKKLEAVYDEIEALNCPQPAIYPMDLEGATEKDYQDLAANIEKEFGRLDGILHNAAILGHLTPIEQFNLELWYKIMQVNLNAPFMLTRACLHLLKQSEDASIIFTSDQVGRKGRAYWGAYGVSKFAIEGLMQILADELETNTPIRVNSIDPGPTRTQLRSLAYPAEDQNKLPAPDEIMDAYLYLMGPSSKGVTGEQFDAQEFSAAPTT